MAEAGKPGSVSTLPVVSSGELLPPRGKDAEAVYGPARFDRADRYHAQRVALGRAQLLNLLLAATVLALLGGLLYHASRTHIRPYVVEVDRHGEALAFGPAAEMADPDRRMILHALTLWIVHARTVTIDRTLERREILAAYAYTGGRAVALLNAWFKRHPPFARAERETVSVDVESLLAADETNRRFRLQWTETVRNPAGALLREELWQALVTLEVHPPAAVEEVLSNPLGIRVTDFDWQRLTTPGEKDGPRPDAR